MTTYEFQWGGAHTFSSIFDRSCFTYGPHALGTLANVDYVAFGENSKVDCYISQKMVQEWNQLGEKLLGPVFSENYLTRCQNARQEMDQFYKKFKATDLNQATPAELYEFTESLTEHIRQIGGLFVATQQAGTLALETTVRSQLTKIFGPDQAEQAFATLSQPVTLDIINREQIDFAHLAMQDQISESELKGHAEKHAWLFYQTYDSAAVLRFLKKRLENARETAEDQGVPAEWSRLKAAKKELEKEQAAIFQKLDAKTAEQCRLLQKLALERLELKNHWAGADWRFLPLFKQMSKRFAVPLIDLINAYSLDDLKAAVLDGQLLDPKMAQERRECYAVRNHQGTRTYAGGKDAVAALKEKLGIKEPQAQHPIRGTVANPGKVSGRAYLVTVGGLDELVKDEADFPEGAVMVVTMTQPNQLSLVKKACAIVADEGGSVSHAAVLARELNKPCIVGAKIATRTLKTGDWVEVDADEGVVRKINKEKAA